MKTVALWMYRNENGDVIQNKICNLLHNRGYKVINNFDMRDCYYMNGKVYTKDHQSLSDVDVLYHMNADEQTDYQNEILRFIEESGVKVFNTFDSFHKGKDKMLCNLILRKNNINVPPALFIGRKIDACFVKSILTQWGKVLIKPRDGHGGKGIIQVKNFEEFYDFYQATNKVFDSYYIEKFIEFGEHDYRVEIFNGKVIGGYSRKRNHSYKTNISSGGEMLDIPLNDEVIETGLRAAKALGITTTIVDMIKGIDDNQLYVLEVNYQMGIFVEEAMKSGSKLPKGVKIESGYSYDDIKINEIVSYIEYLAEQKS